MYDAYAQAVDAPPPTGTAAPWSHLVADLGAHAPMMAAHLATAVVVALWLARGERALWDLLVLAAHRLLVLPALVAPVPAGAPRVRPDDGTTRSLPSSTWHSGVCAWRGPPRAA
jgi:hypothetical protein